MKHSRTGESLWAEWDGSHYEPKLQEPSVTLYTVGHVDIHQDVVKRALASAIQRYGIYDSLGGSYAAVDSENTSVLCSYAGYVDGDRFLSLCEENGFTETGEEVDEPCPVTWVEIGIYE